MWAFGRHERSVASETTQNGLLYYSNREGEAAIKALRDFESAKRYLERFYKNIRPQYSLDVMGQLMAYLDNPQDQVKTIHVAGTSGKTSTCYYLAALLTAAGQKTGLTVSPHMDEINERVQLNGEPIGEKEFCTALSEFLQKIEDSGLEPSWFEVMAAFAFWYFAREQVDYAIVEVGLGGLLDGTNVINRADKVAVITDIGLDHTNVLGNTLPEIAAQKIGIVQPHNAVITYRQAPEIMRVYENYCQAQQSRLLVYDPEDDDDFRLRNWRLANHAFDVIKKASNIPGLSKADLERTMSLQVPGRLDVITAGGKIVVMDGAHNEQKMEAFIKDLNRLYPGQRPAVLISLKDGKDYEPVCRLVAKSAARVIITSFRSDQDTAADSMDLKKLAQAFEKNGVSPAIINDQAEAVKALLGGPEDLCVITGSLYLLGQIRSSKLLA